MCALVVTKEKKINVTVLGDLPNIWKFDLMSIWLFQK